MRSNFYKEIMNLLELAILKYGSAKKLSEESGVSPANISRWRKGERVPRLEEIAPIFDLFDVNIKYANQEITVKKSKDEKYFPVSIYAIAGAGPAWELEDSDPIAQVMVPLSDINKSDFAFKVVGDSMHPTIANNSFVGIKEHTDFIPNEVYAIRLPYQGLAIKRISINHTNKTYIIRSDNHDQNKYPPEEISIDENPNFIVGRVVWVWQNV